MGLPVSNHKRVIIPTYKTTDHVPEYYLDPHSGGFIPTGYFLDNLDSIGPQHWQNWYSSDITLHVVGTTYNGNYNHNNNVGHYRFCNNANQMNQLGLINDTMVSESGFGSEDNITITVPHPEVFEPILHWLYHHDDDSWLDEMSLENFQQIYENVKYLKLGKEAYDVLDQFILEVEETGIEIKIDGVVE
ncbi:2776_t:CDS:2 [Ambispora leptoticha]|uniref:2776_t:CDS:1 n=1 Tax=Ambispora leptoticha TaxID=144679 RepID=A0A9N9F0U7_9GLOM|nr:2776_t:CDS:2 [Ambispora leptoticha]